jgi:hypothetical protein
VLNTRLARLLAHLAQLLLHCRGGVKQETTRAQNHRAWEEVRRTVYPAVPRVTPAPLLKTPHRRSPAPDA